MVKKLGQLEYIYDKNFFLFILNIQVREGNLYFHIDGDKGAIYYCNFTKECFKVKKNCYFHISIKIFQKNDFQLISSRIPFKKYYAPSLKNLINDKKFSDISFIVGKQENQEFISNEENIVYAHKNILTARSDYFKAMFTVISLIFIYNYKYFFKEWNERKLFRNNFNSKCR